jgi:hypothetical protein
MLQAKITLEASRLDALVPDRLVPEASTGATAAPPSRFDVERMLGAPDDASPVVLEPSAGSVAGSSSPVMPALGAADSPPPTAEATQISRSLPSPVRSPAHCRQPSGSEFVNSLRLPMGP